MSEVISTAVDFGQFCCKCHQGISPGSPIFWERGSSYRIWCQACEALRKVTPENETPPSTLDHHLAALPPKDSGGYTAAHAAGKLSDWDNGFVCGVLVCTILMILTFAMLDYISHH